MLLKRGEFIDLLKHAAGGWVDHRASSMGAAIAYYTVLSMAPLLLIVIAIAGLAFGQEAAQGAVVGQLQGLIGTEGAKTVQDMLASGNNLSGGVISIMIGLGVLLIGATTVFAELQSDLDLIWGIPKRSGNGAVNFVRTRLLSFGIVLGVGFLLIVSLLVTAALAALGKFWGEWLGGFEAVAYILNFVIALGFITVLFALIFKYLPNTYIAWRDVWIGSALTSVLFSIGKFGIGLYLGKSATASSFGAAGAFVVLIVWIYYASQIFLFGAEFTAQYARKYGSKSKKFASLAELINPVKPATASTSAMDQPRPG